MSYASTKLVQMVNDEHEPIRELSGAAALRALTPDEARLVSAHLATCPACRAELEELRETAELLLRAPEPIRPPPELRARVMAAIALEARRAGERSGGVGERGSGGTGERGNGRAGDGNGDGELLAPSSPRALPRSSARRWDWRDLGMVASLALALFFGYWTARLSGELSAQSAQIAEQRALVRAATEGRIVQMAATGPAPQVRGAVAESPAGAVVYLEDLPQPPPDRAYEVWLIPPGGQPIGAGLSSAGQGGTQTIPLNRPLAGIQQVAVTEEPARGSVAPTTPILAAATL